MFLLLWNNYHYDTHPNADFLSQHLLEQTDKKLVK